MNGGKEKKGRGENGSLGKEEPRGDEKNDKQKTRKGRKKLTTGQVLP